MSNFTEKQQAFIEARIEGLNKTQAAIQAGYASAGADRQGAALEKRHDIKEAITAGKRKSKRLRSHMESHIGKPAGRGGKGRDDEPRMKPKYGSSLELLQHTYNNPLMPDSVRMRAAEQALPYEHGRVGETGKKKTTEERAAAITGDGKPKKASKRHKFAPIAGPRVVLLQGGKK